MPTLACPGVQSDTQRTSSQTPKGPVPLLPENDSCLRISNRMALGWPWEWGSESSLTHFGGTESGAFPSCGKDCDQPIWVSGLAPRPSHPPPPSSGRQPAFSVRSGPGAGAFTIPLGSLQALLNLPPSGEQGRPGSIEQLTSPTLSLPVSLK